MKNEIKSIDQLVKKENVSETIETKTNTTYNINNTYESISSELSHKGTKYGAPLSRGQQQRLGYSSEISYGSNMSWTRKQRGY